VNPVVMGILLFIALTTLTWSLGRRIIPLFAMKPEKRWDRPYERLCKIVKFGIGQARFLQRFEMMHGIAHLLIFWGFLVVNINNFQLIGRGFVENWSLPGFHGTDLGMVYAFLKNLFALSVIIGVLLALGRRVILKPERMLLSVEANLILLWIFSIEVADIIYEGTLFMIHPGTPDQGVAFLSDGFMRILFNLGYTGNSELVHSLNTFGFWGHLVMALAFLNYLPYCKQFHEITSFFNLFFSDLESRGRLIKQDFANKKTIFGVCKVEEFSWKRGLDMHTCAECGRCHANCPAHMSEKPLSPMHLIMDEREHLKKKTSLMIQAVYHKARKQSSKVNETLESWTGETLTGEVIKDDAIWSCTTCGHCIAICPLLIEHIPNIIDLRRYLVQLAGRIPQELSTVFKNWQNMSNPWGMASNARADWFESLGVETPKEKPDFEYLYYVGCAGSFDDRNKKVATTFVRLMQKAGVNFVCMGNDERCCGETARRLGNEYLGQSMIQENIRVWNETGVKKIVTACPHCYNTIRNEYPQFGGHYEVVHHTEMILKFIVEGKIGLTLPFNHEGPIVYHDPCYLSRHNNTYETPRKVLNVIPDLEIVEPNRNRNISFCCGGGGGRMWMEEKIGRRINHMRCEQLLDTGSKVFVTACPYCLIMLDDAIKEKFLEDEVRIFDLVQIADGSVAGVVSS